ncbi:hypothetical protein FACS189499_06770 [Clostridia bacterium]|nr:hypothetical protein FACS189499_06770 [Clostridia bacterium]
MDVDIQYKFTPNALRARAVNNKMMFEIFNYGDDAIKISNPNKVSIHDMPSIDVAISTKDYDYFYLYFSYGDSPGDITTVDNAETLTLSSESSDWVVQGSKSPKYTYFYTIAAYEDCTIPPRSSVSFTFSAFSCNGASGSPMVTLIYHPANASEAHTSYYQDLYKYDAPVINSFKADELNYMLGEKINLRWDADKVGNDYIIELDGNRISDNPISVILCDKNYTLTISSPANEVASVVFTPTINYINSFDFVELDGTQVKLKWDLTPNCSGCNITRSDDHTFDYNCDVSGSGSDLFDVSKMNDVTVTFTLTAKTISQDNMSAKTKSTSFSMFNARFSGYWNSIFSTSFFEYYNSIKDNLLNENEFLTLDEINDTNTTRIISVPYDGGGGGGTFHYYCNVDWNIPNGDYITIEAIQKTMFRSNDSAGHNDYYLGTNNYCSTTVTAYKKDGSSIQHVFNP